MEKEKIKQLKTKAQALQPMLRIGKRGLDQSVLNELALQLKKKKLIKIKLLKSSTENMASSDVIKTILDSTKSTLIDKVGNIVVLHRK